MFFRIVAKRQMFGLVLIVSVLGCATKRKSSPNPETVSDQTAISDQKITPLPEAKNVAQVVGNLQTVARDQSRKLAQFETSDVAWKNVVAKLDELAATDPKKLEAILSDPKLDAFKFDVLDAVLEKNPKNKVSYTGVFAGTALLLASASLGVASYLKGMPALTEAQKTNLKNIEIKGAEIFEILRTAPGIDVEHWFENIYDNQDNVIARQLKEDPNAGLGDAYAEKWKRFNKYKYDAFVRWFEVSPGDSLDTVKARVIERTNAISADYQSLLEDRKRTIGNFDYLDSKHHFLTEKDFVKKAWIKKWVRERLDLDRIRNSDSYVYVNPDDSSEFINASEYESKLRGSFNPDKPTLEQKQFMNKNLSSIKEQRKIYADFREKWGIRPGQTLSSAKSLNPPLPERSSLSKGGMIAGFVGSLVGAGLAMYNWGKLDLVATADPAQEALKETFIALSEVEIQLWKVREALHIGE